WWGPGRPAGEDEVSGARTGTKSQLNEADDSQHLGALENRIEVAIVKTDGARSAHEDCASCFEAFDSLFDSLPAAVCDTPGHSVAQTVRPLCTRGMSWHTLTGPGKIGQSPLNPKVQGSTPCASTIMLCKFR